MVTADADVDDEAEALYPRISVVDEVAGMKKVVVSVTVMAGVDEALAIPSASSQSSESDASVELS